MSPLEGSEEKWEERNNQSLKGAVVMTHCQSEAEVKFQMDIDHQISLTEQKGKSD